MGGNFYAIEDLFPLGDGSLGAWISSDHQNIDEDFANYELVRIADGKIAFLYNGPFLYSVKSGTKAAFFSAKMTLLSSKHGGLNDVNIVVTERSRPEAAKAGRAYEWNIVWDAGRGKYRGGSKELLKRIERLRGEL